MKLSSRLARRAALAGLVLAAAASAPAGAPPGDAPPAAPEPSAVAAAQPSTHRALARELFAELVRMDTSHPAGTTSGAAHWAAARLRAAGFAAEDVQVLEPALGKANLLARLRGRDPARKPLLLLAHLDVVSAERADWSVEPFELLERDGYFWGRGSSDAKDQAAIHLANLIRLRQEGARPARDVVLALTADEEAGEHNGVRWLLAEHGAQLDAALALNEGGSGVLSQGRRAANLVQASEKLYQDFELQVRDPGGHSSLPRADNPIYRLSEALLRIRERPFPIELNAVTRAFFERSAAHQPPELAAAMRGALREPPDARAQQSLARIPLFGALLRTTCTATRVEAGHALNALPQRARAHLNCRALPGTEPAQLEAALRERIADPRVELRRLPDPHAQASSASPLLPAVFAAIERSSEELWPGVPVLPHMSTGATDSLFLRNAGIPAYGVTGIFHDIDDVRAHGVDERVPVSSFYEGLEFLYRLTARLAELDDAQLVPARD